MSYVVCSDDKGFGGREKNKLLPRIWYFCCLFLSNSSSICDIGIDEGQFIL